MTTYRDLLQTAMTMMGHHPRTVVVGYNTSSVGGFGGGSFSGFPEDRIEEMPLAEESMAGAAVGMAIDGWIPILWQERFDFITNCLDPIVNHLDKLAALSEGIHRPAVIIRCAVGNKNVPLFTGPTHTQDLSVAMSHMVSFSVVNLRDPSTIVHAYASALERAEKGISSMIVEYRDLYNEV